MRKSVAIVWLMGGTLTVLALGAMLLACCILPFHVHHGREPLCHAIAEALAGEHQDPPSTAEPAEPLGKRASAAPTGIAADGAADAYALVTSAEASEAAYDDPGARNVMTLGAERVDDDVGLHALFCTFLI